MFGIFAIRRQTRARDLLLTLSASLSASLAQAALTDNLGVSVKAMSMGNAVTADPPGIDSIHFNPAGLTRLEGTTKQDSVFAASLRSETKLTQPDGFDIGGWTQDPVAGQTTGQIKQKVYIPGVGPSPWRLPVAAAAGMGFSYNKPDSPWTFATAVYAPQAVGMDRTNNGGNDPGRFDGQSVVIQRLVYLSPSVGYKVSRTFSVGLSVPIAHQAFALNTDLRFPNKLLGVIGKLQDAWCGDGGNPLDTFGFGLCGGGQDGRLRPFNKAGGMGFDLTSPIDPTFNLGALWEPTDWFAFGMVYQSGTKTTLTGSYTFEATPMFRKFVEGMYSSLLGPVAASMFGFPTSIPEYQSGNATMRLPFPAHWQFGIKLKPVDRVQFNMDVNYTDWRQWNSLEIQFDQQVALLEMARVFGQADPSKLVIPRNYRDPIHLGFGLELGVTQAFKLRFGYEPRKTSVPESAFDLIAPLPRMNVRSIGVGYQSPSGMTINATASYAKGKYNIPAETSCNANCSNFFNVIYNPYAGLDLSGSTTIRYGGVSVSRPF